MTDSHITKIHCTNFRVYRDRLIEDLAPGLNVLIGDNETGKSTILLALDLVLRASDSRVRSIGLESLMNREAVEEFLGKESRTFADLPTMEIDLYLDGVTKHEYEGAFNALNVSAFGICLLCRPREDLRNEIAEVISLEGEVFPFEYYSIELRTFSGAPLTPFKRPLEHVTIDNTRISSEYASRAYVRDMYKANTEDTEQSRYQIKYRQAKAAFADAHFGELNGKLDADAAFALRSSNKANLETDLTIKHRDIDVDNLGVGMQCFIRTSFALSKKANIDVVLLEEPENHLSHLNMKKLIARILKASRSQVFIATHSSYICSRLDLRKAILFGSPAQKPVRLKDIPEDTAKFFMKAPNNNLLEFIQSARCMLVEGDAEYMLLSAFFKTVTGESIEDGDVAVVAVGGLSFRRYLEIARLLKNKVAVVTDNDGDPSSDRLNGYRDFVEKDHIEVFTDADSKNSTFEKSVYDKSKEACDSVLGSSRRSLTAEEYMLKNKSEASYLLVEAMPANLQPPDYIREAITWIRD